MRCDAMHRDDNYFQFVEDAQQNEGSTEEEAEDSFEPFFRPTPHTHSFNVHKVLYTAWPKRTELYRYVGYIRLPYLSN
jgi:hypothetical protein